MSNSVVYKHYLRAISLWPKDLLRPEVQFRDALRRRADRRFLPASATTATSSSPSPASKSTPANDDAKDVAAASPRTVTVNEADELEQVNALYSLLEGRYEKKYSLQDILLSPKSDPDHYTNLMKELDEAPTRTFWRRITSQWKGFLRFS